MRSSAGFPSSCRTAIAPQDGGSGTGPGAGKVWGLAVIIVDVETVFREAGLADGGDTMMEFAMRGRDGLGASGEVFLGRPELFAAQSGADRHRAAQRHMATGRHPAWGMAGRIALQP